jgi:hypothetical protein
MSEIMSEQERRLVALEARPAIMVFSDAIRAMRATFPDDRHYLAFIRHLEGVCIAERSWLTAIAEGKANASAGQRGDGNYEAAKVFREGKFSLPLVADVGEFPG